MPYPGSLDQLSLTVDPYDTDTLATLTLTAPDGTTSSPSTASTDHHTWAATPTYTQAGKWVAAWTVTGTGSGITYEDLWVSAPASPAAAVVWRPELWQVADLIPGRTLTGAVDGYGNALATFTADTHPTADQVQRLITGACSWVLLKTGPIDPTLSDAAREIAALRAAGLVEQGYPDNRDDLNTAAQLLAQAQAMRDDLWKANEAATGQAPEDPAALMPVYSFDPPNPQGGWYGGGWDGDYFGAYETL